MARARVLPLARRRRHPSPGAGRGPRRIAIVAYPDFQLLDVTGPLEVFAQAARFLATSPPAYTVEILTSGPRPLVSSSGVRLVPDGRTVGSPGGIDTLMVAGGPGVAAAVGDRALVAWVRRTARRVRRLASVCSGTFLLARAGLLDGRRATTHWQVCDQLARLYPRVMVERDPIFVRDRGVYTSAGVTAGMDLALALVEEDHGRELALRVARQLVMFLKRPGGQSQFSAQLAVQSADREPLRELQAWIADHLDGELAVPTLAAQVAMSERNFARVFRREVGCTPARFVERARVEGARRRLEESSDGVDVIAGQCGFASPEVMRRAFLRLLGVPPSAYRGRFRSAVRA
ncbi:MAG TPA: GlxA family transcriptional regulator [Candidatus Binatus sp.]|nr:GlxA family transcriptional regulator [Candidatus Binatus sp.]